MRPRTSASSERVPAAPSARTVTRTCSPARKPVPATANGCHEATRSCGFAVDPPAASPAESPPATARAATDALNLRIGLEDNRNDRGPLSRKTPGGLEPPCRALQARASPLGHG